VRVLPKKVPEKIPEILWNHNLLAFDLFHSESNTAVKFHFTVPQIDTAKNTASFVSAQLY
jgi:hypothetical protein